MICTTNINHFYRTFSQHLVIKHMIQLQHLVITTIDSIIGLLNLREWFVEFISI